MAPMAASAQSSMWRKKAFCRCWGGRSGETLRHRNHVLEGNVGHRGAHPNRDPLHGHPTACVLHDFDPAGIIIKDTLENDTRRYSYKSPPNVIDLGLHYDDIDGLTPEPHSSNISDERLKQAGLSEAATEFLSDQRVELNAMTSRQLIDFVERKLKQHGVGKVIPIKDALASTFQMFAAGDSLSQAFDELKEEIHGHGEAQIKVPDDLEAKVKAKLEERPDMTWHRAVRLIVDPDADFGEHEEQPGELDDEDLNDIDE
jgi:hypothetical protein